MIQPFFPSFGNKSNGSQIAMETQKVIVYQINETIKKQTAIPHCLCVIVTYQYYHLQTFFPCFKNYQRV